MVGINNIQNMRNGKRMGKEAEKMCETLGYNNFCSACKGSREENGELVCRDKGGRFYGFPVKHVLLAPCMNRKALGGVEGGRGYG